MGFAIMIMILSAAVSAAFMFRDVPFDKYTSNVTRGQSDIVNEAYVIRGVAAVQHNV